MEVVNYIYVVFLNEEVKLKNNYEIIFSLPFYEHDEMYCVFKGEVDYNIFNELEWCDLEKMILKKIDKCILSLINENKKSDLSLDISKFIENNFNKKLLFTHSLYPTNYLLYEIWKSIFDNLNINIIDYNYDLNKNELINCSFNPFTIKMMIDLDIQFEV